MAKLLKWQQKYIEYAKKLNNKQLFESVLYDANGDTWEGLFTQQGWWKYDYLTKELRNRLEEVDFFRNRPHIFQETHD